MTKKNIRPQQAAPVQRETVGNFFTSGKMTAAKNGNGCRCMGEDSEKEKLPFAGDDAE